MANDDKLKINTNDGEADEKQEKLHRHYLLSSL
jgi:hypothetical protein